MHVNATNKDGETALHFAVMHENTDLVTFLLEKGTDVNARNKNGCSPQNFAGYKKNIELAILLLEKNISKKGDKAMNLIQTISGTKALR
ncbi:hypothetical protein CL657_06080 [bacterium]|nr:hypothetical protein [bacterium]